MALNLENIDLGGFGISDDTVQPEANPQVRANVNEALKINPDEHAKNAQLSRESGVPTQAVRSDPAAVEHALKLDNIDFSGMSKRNPNTAKYLTDFNNSVIAQDDIDVLQTIEDTLTEGFGLVRSFDAGVISTTGITLEGVARTLQATQNISARILDAVLPESADEYLYLSENPSELEKIGLWLTPQTHLAPAGRLIKRFAEIVDVPKEDKGLKNEIAHGLGGLAQQIVVSIVNPAASGVALFAQGVDQQGERQEKTKTEGLTLEADLAVLGGGVITAVLEKTGIDALLNRIPPKIKNKVLRNVTDIALAGGIEAVQEVVEDIGQGLLEQFTTNPDAVIFKNLEHTAVVAGSVGAIAKAVINGFVPGRSRGFQETEEAKQSQGEVEQQKIDKLNDQAIASKTRTRNKESFKEFVETSDGENNTHVFLDAERVTVFLQDKTPDEIEADAALKLLAEQARSAANTESDVQVPIADFAADIAGTEHYTALRDAMTLSAAATSPFRQEEVNQQNENFVKSLIEEADTIASEFIEAQEIFTKVRDQLIDSGQFNASNASIAAQIVPAWATAQAQRQGKTVEQVYRDSGLTVEGPQTGERARLDEQVLSQPIDPKLNDLLDEFETLFPELAGRPLTDEENAAADKIESQIGESEGSIFKIQKAKDRRDELNLPEERTKIAGFTEQRVSELLEDYTHENGLESNARIAYIDPIDFVALTHPDVTRIESETAPLDVEELQSQVDVPNLRIQTDGKIITHEGRHRMMALAKAGFKSVPVVIAQPEFTSTASDMSLKGQEFTQGTGIDVVIENAVPILPTTVGQFTDDNADLLFQDDITTDQPDKNLFVAHNLSAENILAANDLGGLAAPSIAVARSDISDFSGFGEVTLLAKPSLLDDPKARTFDADVYSPRQPRAVYDIDQDVYSELYQQLDPDNLGLSKPDVNSLEDTQGADNLLRSEAVEYHWLKLQGKDPKIKNAKVEPIIKKAEKLGLDRFDMESDPEFIKLATGHYKKQADEIAKNDELRGERVQGWFFEDNGDLKSSKIRDLASQVQRFRETGGKDVSKLREGIVKKIRVKKNRDEYQAWVFEQFTNMVTSKKIFKGFTPSGNRKYSEYNLQNVVKEMTQQLQAGESFFYGAGTVRSKYANEMKTIAQVQAKRDEIVSEEDMTKVKEESAEVFTDALDALKPFYKFDSDSFGYSDDAGNAIIEGRKGLNETFDMTPEAQTIVDDLLEYLTALPTSYFESKIQRAVDFSEFDTAVVPRGFNKDALKVLKDSGLKVKTYDSKDSKSRAEVIAKQERLLFQPATSESQSRGYYDPVNSVIRLNEASDLSTFLHEFGHFMYQMEVDSKTELGKDINSWFKRNGDEVAKEANGYLGAKFDADKQLDQPPIKVTQLDGQGDVEKVKTGEAVSFYFIHNTESATGILGKPKKGDQFGRDFEPAARFINVSSKENSERVNDDDSKFIGGEITFRNPLVLDNDGLKWKKTLSKKYGGKTGKKLSKALIADGFDGVITTEDRYISETIDLTTFDEAKALFQPIDDSTGQGFPGAITTEDVNKYLDEGTTGVVEKDSAIRRAVHEQFARGFETYLMEGKASSIELRNAFRTFARWLSQIYQFIKGDLNVKVDAQMREVFDRLLATDEQIKAASDRARHEPLFKDEESSGMTKEEFADYQTRQSKVKDVESETLRDKIIAQLTRQAAKQWKDERQDIIDEQIDELSKDRVYIARDRLRSPALTKPFDDAIAEFDKELTDNNKRITQLNKDNDTVGQFISKAGGLNRESMLSEGVDPEHFKDKFKVFGKPLSPKVGGLTADGLAEKLNETGFNGGSLTANDALSIVSDMLLDDTQFIDGNVTAEISELERSNDSIEQERIEVEEQSQQVNVKLDHAAVKQLAGEEKTNKLGRTSVIIPSALKGMTKKGGEGIHPDQAAAVFGYNSGSEMIDDIVNAPKIGDLAREKAEAEMIERHGDILNDGTIQREADEAVQSEERGKLILHELKVLARGSKAPTIDRATMQSLAQERVGRLSFREIHPGKYRKAEIRAAQESSAMLVQGNKEGAAAAKLRQVTNYYLGLEATKAKNETVKIVDRMARYNKKKVREEILKSGNQYWEQIAHILDRFEFRKSATLKEVDSINLWAKDRMEADGDGLILSNAVLNESLVTHWKNITYTDLQGVNDSVKNIEHVARYANKIKTEQADIDFREYRDQWVSHIGEQDQRFDTKNSRSRLDDSRKATLAENIRRWASQLTKIPFLAAWLDGGERAGLSHEVLIQPLTDALDAKMRLVDDVANPVLKAITERSKVDQARHQRKIYIPEINDNLQGHQILAVALNVGNEGNLKKLLLGEGWADPDVDTDITFDNPKLQAILAHMSVSDWRLVQQIWDSMESLYPQLAEVHRRTTGLNPPKVVSTPINTSVKEGGKTANLTLRGGYYPVKYSPVRSHKAEKNAEKREAETESLFNNGASIQASVNTGATNERTGFYDRMHLSLEVVPDHFNETIHYITHHDPVRQINRLIQSPDVADAITGVLGESEFKELKPWLNDVAKDGRQQPVKTYLDEAFQRLRFGTTLGVMGFKASTGIMQLFGILTTASELGVGPTVKGVQTVVGNAWYMKSVRSLLGSRDDMQSGYDFAAERSKVLPHRVKTMDREIRNAMNRLQGKTGALAAVQEVSMKHIALIQTYMIDLPTWHAAYGKHLSENGDETKAAQFADVTLENTQGSGATKDMARIMRSQSKIHSTFTMFMTFFSSLGNLTRDLVKGTKSGQYSPTSAAAKAMFLFTLPVFFEMSMRGELDEPEDDDERLSKFATKVALYPLTSIPFVRDVASGALSDFGYNSSPVASMMGRGIESGSALVGNIMTDEEVTKSQIKNTSKLIGAAIGIPGTNQAWATGEHLYDVIEDGEDFTAREFLFGPDRK